jgi:mono/diheme cytochrome c family protein
VKKVLVALVVVVAILAAAAGAAVAGAAWLGERKLARFVDVRVVPVAYAKDPAAAKLGKHLFESRGCAHCHGDDGRGISVTMPFAARPSTTAEGIEVRAPNITRGPGGVVSDYNEGDWVRAIRHGVNPAGHALLFMPSDAYNRMHDGELAAVVAYVRSLPPVAGESATISLPLAFKVRYALGLERDASEKIDQRKPPPLPVAASPNAAFGAYLAPLCTTCHASVGPMERYDTLEKFATLVRTGRRPDGSEVAGAMPFLQLRNLDDVELAALYAHFRGGR